MWKINEREIQAVLELSHNKRFNYFIKKVVDWQMLFGLRNESGWVLYASDNGIELIPVWPHPKYVKLCATGDWSDCEASPISLDEWLDKWLPGIRGDNRKVAVFPTPSNKGIIISADELRSRIMEECENY